MTRLVLVPGLLCDDRIWAETSRRLPEPATIVDLTRAASLTDMADVILAAASQRSILVGFSMGAMAALHAGSLAPDRIAGLVLIGSHAQDETAERRAVREQQIARVRQEGLNWLLDEVLCPAYFDHRDPEDSVADRALTRDMAMRAGAEIFCRHSLALTHRPALAATGFPPDHPFAVIAGAEDKVVPPALSEALARQAGHGSFHLLPGAGHMIPLERPEAISTILREVIDHAPG